MAPPRLIVEATLPAGQYSNGASAFGADAEVKGMITSRTGETLIVKTADGNRTIVLTDNTTTKDDKGLFGLDKHRMSNVVLIPGLKVDVEGTSDDQSRVVAKTITVDGDDLESAEMIQSGLHPTAEQVEANVQRLEAHGGKLESHSVQLASQKESIHNWLRDHFPVKSAVPKPVATKTPAPKATAAPQTTAKAAAPKKKKAA